METNINGCMLGAYSRLSNKCRQCMHKEYCQSKRMEHVGYLIPALQMAPNEKIDISFMKNYGVTVEEAQDAIIKGLTALSVRNYIDIKEGG